MRRRSSARCSRGPLPGVLDERRLRHGCHGESFAVAAAISITSGFNTFAAGACAFVPESPNHRAARPRRRGRDLQGSAEKPEPYRRAENSSDGVWWRSAFRMRGVLFAPGECLAPSPAAQSEARTRAGRADALIKHARRTTLRGVFDQTKFRPTFPVPWHVRVIQSLTGLCCVGYGLLLIAKLIKAFVWEGGDTLPNHPPAVPSG